VTGQLLGGSLAPIGLAASFLRERIDVVRSALLAWRRDDLHQTVEENGPIRFPECTKFLEPLEAPWTVELLIDSGDWTTYLNNWIQGGDPTAAAPYLATRLECDCVVSVHAPPCASGHASTQLWLIGPEGTPPLMHLRTIAAHAEDGRWSWETSGEPLSWERPERYGAQRIRDRLDRPLLVEYLGAMGIRVDDASFYGEGFCLRQIVSYARRQETAAQVRGRFGWSAS
jgi:hypothetical protein